MSLVKLLRQIAWLAVLPALVMWVIAMIGPGQPSELTSFCIKYWWITFVLGASVFCLLRSVAWFIHKAGMV